MILMQIKIMHPLAELKVSWGKSPKKPILTHNVIERALTVKAGWNRLDSTYAITFRRDLLSLVAGQVPLLQECQ